MYDFHNEVAKRRYYTILGILKPLKPFFENKHVLDFGASHGLSMLALKDSGARSVIGIEPEERRVTEGAKNIGEWGKLLYTPDSTNLPFPDAEFDVVFCNAVLEHIPQPRDREIREMWRVLKPNGYLLINETPNKYLPIDVHTTGLPLINWLPSRLARAIAVKTGRFPAHKEWDHSGWRGIGYFELTQNLGKFKNVSLKTRLRHHLVGQLLDPYPEWVLQKIS